MYEIVNVIWKHETLIQDIIDATGCLSIIEDLISWEAIMLIRPDGGLIRDAFDLSIRYKTPFYDMIFVALALRLKLELRTFDKAQSRILSREISH